MIGTLGKCGCCGFNTSEAQRAYAGVPYPVGYARVKNLDEVANYSNYPWNGGLAYIDAIFENQSLGITFDTVYLRLEYEMINSDGSMAYSDYRELSPKDGSVEYGHTTYTGWDGDYWPDGTPAAVWVKSNGDDEIKKLRPNGAYERWKLSVPWTFDQSIQLCEDLLATISLLDTTPTYTSWMDGLEFHFCYGSEMSPLGYSNAGFYNGATGIFYFSGASGSCASANIFAKYEVTRSGAGGSIVSTAMIYAPHGGFNDPSYFQAEALNGWRTVDGYYGATHDYQWIWTSKSAVRHTQSYAVQHNWLRDPATLKFPSRVTDLALQFAVFNYPRGEHIFDRTDVPGYGLSTWFTIEAVGNALGAGGTGSAGQGFAGGENPEI